jgi:hypothetical protein
MNEGQADGGNEERFRGGASFGFIAFSVLINPPKQVCCGIFIPPQPTSLLGILSLGKTSEEVKAPRYTCTESSLAPDE